MKHDHRLKIAFSALLATLILPLILLTSNVASAFQAPAPQGAVTDTSGTLTEEDDQYLENQIAHYRARTGNQLGVLLIRSLEGESIEDVAYKTFNTWGVGKKGIDNGVLLVIAFNDHRSRIETGKGVGDRLTDLQASRILTNRLAPQLRAGHVREGIDVTLVAIEGALDQTPSRSPPAPSESLSAFSVLILVILALPFAAVIFSIYIFVRGLKRKTLRFNPTHGAGTYDRGVNTAYDASTAGSYSATHSAIASTPTHVSTSSFSGFDGGASGGGGASGSW